jgi:hypothetical protein
MKSLVSAFVLLSFALALAGTAQAIPAKDDPKAPNERVQKLFAAMREGTYKDVWFGELKLKWEDIPALLEIGGSKHVLQRFPHNPLSSQAQFQCPEGMVALWLVEGIRKGGKDFPSLNALCLPSDSQDKKWDEASAKSQGPVLEAYQKWWKQIQGLPFDKAAAVDPLKETNLGWH